MVNSPFLDNGCVYVGIVQHEMAHAACVYDEHSHYDRDEYIDIKWKIIHDE